MLKGTLFHEGINLPLYWLKMFLSKPTKPEIQKIRYDNHSSQYFLSVTGKYVNPDLPKIVYNHGGGWAFGNPESFIRTTEIFNNLGYEVFMPSYRKLFRHPSKCIFDDIEAAFTKIVAISKSKQYIIGGISAGGQLSLYLGFNHQIKEVRIKAIFNCAGPIDFHKMPKSILIKKLTNNFDPRFMSKISVSNSLKTNSSIPTLSIFGTNDGMVPFDSQRKSIKICTSEKNKFIITNYTHMEIAAWTIDNIATKENIVNFVKKHS